MKLYGVVVQCIKNLLVFKLDLKKNILDSEIKRGS